MRESGFITDWIEEDIPPRFQLGFLWEFHQGIKQGKRLLIIRQLAAKFGEIPQSVMDQIQGITADEELDQLGIRLLTADSLEEMGLNGGASR